MILVDTKEVAKLRMMTMRVYVREYGDAGICDKTLPKATKTMNDPKNKAKRPERKRARIHT